MNTCKALALTALLTWAGGCDTSNGPEGTALCQDSVSVSVGSGTTPSISWTPHCRASELIVDPNSDIVDYWVIRAVGDTNGLQPPVQYGTTPNGATTVVQPGVLQAGTTYRARIVRATGDTALPFVVIGSTYFQP